MMHNRLAAALYLLLSTVFIIMPLSATSDYYDFSSEQFEPIRVRRGTREDEEDNRKDWWKKPVDVETTNTITDHTYYEMQTYPAVNDTFFNEHLYDVDAMINGNAVGNRSHPLLSDSYRRAVSSKISFDFPFYGHLMNNLTIATGGFIYIGDQMHSWLAATQYIAPLMANFDTHPVDANIKYADDGTKFVIEWTNVVLRDQNKDGAFTFQLSLHKNGDIWFVYKDIPIPVDNISDTYHPRKLGISDAYLFSHNGAQQNSKRVIYEYHRVEVPTNKVVSNSVVLLIAQPTCIMLRSCDQCANATLKQFNCSWCHAKDKHGGPFCSDDAGLHRRRQQWIEGNCKEQSRNMYCATDVGNDENNVDEDDETKEPVTDSPLMPSHSDDTRHNSQIEPDTDAYGSDSASSGGVVALIVVFSTIFALIGWIAYAYYNPHSTSGQYLIRYRPTQWHWPSSHVRYSASVHM